MNGEISTLATEILGEKEGRGAGQDSAMRQRLHVARKQQSHHRLQCWISRQHADKLQQLAHRLEDNQASLIEQAIELLYRQELNQEMELE